MFRFPSSLVPPLVLSFKGTVGRVMENTWLEDQAGSSSHLFPVDINFDRIIVQETFGTAVPTEEMNGGKMKHLCGIDTPVFVVVKEAGLGWATQTSFQCHVPGMEAVLQRVLISAARWKTLLGSFS